MLRLKQTQTDRHEGVVLVIGKSMLRPVIVHIVRVVRADEEV